jgi:hypothetical protein
LVGTVAQTRLERRGSSCGPVAPKFLATGERANTFLVIFLYRYPMILVDIVWFVHVSGRSGGRATTGDRANGRANAPRAQAIIVST